MGISRHATLAPLLLAGLALFAIADATAAPRVTRLTPPSLKFSEGREGAPYIAQFFTGQRFDLSATVQPDSGKTITDARFFVDGKKVPGVLTLIPCTAKGVAPGSVAPTLRAYSSDATGVRALRIEATQSDGQRVSATGNFEIRGFSPKGRAAKNVIFMIGDGMGIAHRTAARIVYRGISSGKTYAPLEMDLPNIALVKTASLNSIVTDSAPGASCYTTGNKGDNNQLGVFPDDTTDTFDNPRIELIGEYLARTQGKTLGIVTTADVADATPGAFGSHTQNRDRGTGICDGYLDEQVRLSNLRVLLGGGLRWFLPRGVPGSERISDATAGISDELANAWNCVPRKQTRRNRFLLSEFQNAGFSFASDSATLAALAADPATTKLIGLFANSHMNVAKDKIDGRRGIAPKGAAKTVVADHGFPNQPLLEEMTDAALRVLNKGNPNGFILLVEGASIDKQSHNMDTERWILDTIEFDKAVGVARRFAEKNPGTLIVVTADHECSGAGIIGAADATREKLESLKGESAHKAAVGTYEKARFPRYTLDPKDGYPVTLDIDGRLLIGYAANPDRHEDWKTNPRPVHDKKTSHGGTSRFNAYPGTPQERDTAGGYKVTGHVSGIHAVHTGADVPLSATGHASGLFHGVVENTDVFFLLMQAVTGGAPAE
ncbi:MAG: alkaline phosphatase [Puniceicoccales bacterium]|jgi:alkaline phosphatase|nr:alkaline phosphatase [Puniceicoccales bacterium]